MLPVGCTSLLQPTQSNELWVHFRLIMSDYAAAVERAQSRAAVLQSLQASYGSAKVSTLASKQSGKSSGQKTTSANQPHRAKEQARAQGAPDSSTSAVNNSDKGVVSDMVDVLMTALNDKTMRTKQFFKDSLRGKAIVVENVKAQLDASKASKRIELAGKRKQTISNRAMKRLKIAVPTQLPSAEEIRSLHDLWWEYAQTLMSNCHSEAQLQARLYSMEYVGARVYILESVHTKLVGTVGIITAVSKNCFFLAVDEEGEESEKELVVSSQKMRESIPVEERGSSSASHVQGSIPDGGAKTQVTTGIKLAAVVASKAALTVVKATTTLGIVLPSLHSKHKPSKELLFTDESIELHNTEPENLSNSKLGYTFDHNEKADGGRICVLHGKHFMPHCKFD